MTTSVFASSVTSKSIPDRSSIGDGDDGDSRWIAALTDATTTVPAPPDASRWRAMARRAMVPALGERCSNGRVSQAGISVTSSTNRPTSSTRSSASRSPGTITNSGTSERAANPAIAYERAPGVTTQRPVGLGGGLAFQRPTRGASGTDTGAERVGLRIRARRRRRSR